MPSVAEAVSEVPALEAVSDVPALEAVSEVPALEAVSDVPALEAVPTVAEAVSEVPALETVSDDEVLSVQVEELNLDDIVNLNDFKEVYIDGKNKENDSTQNSDIKKISITPPTTKNKDIVQTIDIGTPNEKNNTDNRVVLNTNEKIKSNIIENYKNKEYKNFNFF